MVAMRGPGDWRNFKNDKEKYAAYLCSREWSEKKRDVMARCGGICERCQNRRADDVHHLTYIRKYAERLEDLTAWCRGCHSFTHGHSDFDPRAYEMWSTRPLLDSMSHSSECGDLVCPFCRCNGVHVLGARSTGREAVVIPMSCESGHSWELELKTRKGHTFAVTQNLRDTSIDQN